MRVGNVVTVAGQVGTGPATGTGELQAMSSVYADAFSEPYPARTTVGGALIGGARVEITVLAVIDGVKRA